MKNILSETVSIIEVTLFWLLALPAAAVIFPAIAGWEKLNAFLALGRMSSTHSFGSRRAVASH